MGWYGGLELKESKDKMTKHPGFGTRGFRAAPGPQSLELDSQMLHDDFLLSSIDGLHHMEKNLQLWEHKPTEEKIPLFPQLRFTNSPGRTWFNLI